MAYSEFTIDRLQDEFGLAIDRADLHASVLEADLPAGLQERIARYLPLVLELGNEKARSELLIAPVLVEFKLLHQDRVSFFTGATFDVDEAAGLNGTCDYLFTRNPVQLLITAP
ncbi:MAG: hypothetical protein K2W96_25535, partial [Gemmataceae bacterium]|nr:hypothetical protein [Gemmataceae bacterium]